jgi:DNA-binding protein HU-beta
MSFVPLAGDSCSRGVQPSKPRLKGLMTMDIRHMSEEVAIMTKAEIVAKVAEEIKISKAAAGMALALVTDSIAQAMRKGEKLTLIGFGTFSVVLRKARKGRSPQTGKEIKIAAKKAPKFSAGAALKAAAEGKAPAEKAKKK